MKYAILAVFCVLVVMLTSTSWADSRNVALVGREPFGSALAVYAQGDYVYLCAGDVLVIIDVYIPRKPIQMGSIDIPGLAYGVHVSGSYAYIAADHEGLRVIDISNPRKPREAGFCDTPGRAREVHVSEGYAYVADREGGLRVITTSGQRWMMFDRQADCTKCGQSTNINRCLATADAIRIRPNLST